VQETSAGVLVLSENKTLVKIARTNRLYEHIIISFHLLNQTLGRLVLAGFWNMLVQ
jgi:hypothetical protein